MRLLVRALVLLCLASTPVLHGGCATRLIDPGAQSGDGPSSSTDGGSVGPGVDAGSFGSPGGGTGVPCGPNTCRGSEVCCAPRCGLCAFPGECGDMGCSG